MATRYVDFVNGADANNGQGPDASHATNKPWKTLTKALGAAGISSGDTLYLSPAGPFRETVSVAMTSAVAETFVIGDYNNAQGFKTSGGVAVAPGPVIVTAYTTNDKTAPSANAILTLAARDFLTFTNIMWVAGNSGGSVSVDASTTTSTNIKFTDCVFLQGFKGSNIHLFAVAGFATALNWTIDRCIFVGGTTAAQQIKITCTTGVGADFDVNFVIKNSLFLGGNAPAVFVTNSGTAANKGNGAKIINCTFMFCGVINTTATQVSTTIPSTVNNCVAYTGGIGCLNAGTSGQITENFNLLVSTAPRTNVTAGANSISDGSYAPLFHFGQERIWAGIGGGTPGPGAMRFLGEPMALSPLLAFGNDGNQTAYDLRNKPRPAGGASPSPAAGAMERGNSFIADPSPIGAGGSAIKTTGPGYAEFLVPVPARAITISCTVKWDATYAGTKPQLQIDANGRIGVAAETKTAVGGSGSNETLTLSAFTPTAAGQMVTVRVISNDTNGGGVLQVDNFTVSG